MGRISKVVFFVESPFNQRDYRRFGVELLEKNGFTVEVWDFTPFLHPDVHEEVKVPDPLYYDRHYIFKSRKEAVNAISGLDDEVFIMLFVGYSLKAYAIYGALSKKGAKYACSVANAMPSDGDNGGVKRVASILRNPENLTPYKLCNYAFLCIPFKFFSIKPAILYLAGGEKSTQSRYPIDSNTKTLWLHSFDYDLYLEMRDKPAGGEDAIGVFLDEYLPFHPDLLHHNLSVPSSPEEYYPLLRRFFDFIEDNYHLKIVIAAHPRSRYEDHPDYYGGRKIIRGKTIELVQKSDLVIMHASTSISFAVLFNKPCIFVTTERLQRTYLGPYINKLSSLFRKEAIKLDGEYAIDLTKELAIDMRVYKDYRNAFIKREGTEELPFWQIVSNKLKQMEN